MNNPSMSAWACKCGAYILCHLKKCPFCNRTETECQDSTAMTQPLVIHPNLDVYEYQALVCNWFGVDNASTTFTGEQVAAQLLTLFGDYLTECIHREVTNKQ